MTTAGQGRAALARWKAEHVAHACAPNCPQQCGFRGSCNDCGNVPSCPTARLIAAVEIMQADPCPFEGRGNPCTDKACIKTREALARLAEPAE